MNNKRHKEQGWCPKCQQITWQEIVEWESMGKRLTNLYCLKCNNLLANKIEDIKDVL
jgi:phage FluMu protein Com